MHSTTLRTSNSDTIPDFLQTLGLLLPVSVEDVNEAYSLKLKSSQVGGSAADDSTLQQAFQQALEYAEFCAEHRSPSAV